MSEVYFDIPYYKRLVSTEGWVRQDNMGTHFHVARAFFRLNISQLPGPASIGRKFDVLGHIEGMTTERIKTVEVETEVFQQVETIERSIVESECMLKILNELTSKFGDGKIFNVGGKVGSEVSAKIKTNFTTDFKITNSSRKRELVKYEFKDLLPSDFKDRVCGVEVYQRCKADLYLIQVDFLNIKYERSMLGLRKKIQKHPFPNNSNAVHPNVIKIGIPLATINYWQPLPQSSLMIKDADYRPEVNDDAEMGVTVPDLSLKDRPYWSIPRHPTLYQLSNVAFPSKWAKIKNSEYTQEELMEIELGEAEESAWWFMYGPGRPKNA